jgi:hypothetical protein
MKTGSNSIQLFLWPASVSAERKTWIIPGIADKWIIPRIADKKVSKKRPLTKIQIVRKPE